jgi:hypothetical protein
VGGQLVEVDHLLATAESGLVQVRRLLRGVDEEVVVLENVVVVLREVRDLVRLERREEPTDLQG